MASRIVPSSRETVDATPRKAMTPKRRARILERDGFKCTYPDCPVSQGLEIDHQISLFLGGKDEDENLVTLCTYHHRKKSALDMKLIAKLRRIVKPKKPSKRPIKSAGFSKTLSRTFNGNVKPRKA